VVLTPLTPMWRPKIGDAAASMAATLTARLRRHDTHCEAETSCEDQMHSRCVAVPADVPRK